MKKCIIVSDSFKGTLSSLDICEIAKVSVPVFLPDWELVTIPVADGGEGTVACFIQALDAETVSLEVKGPYGEPVRAVYCKKERKAVVEMAAAAGLPMVGNYRNPAKTSTYGVGQLIRHAAENGCTEILLGLGGSCTNDGGCGCAAALGARFYNADDALFIPVGETLGQISHIDLSEMKMLLKGIKITVMCDVENPLYGRTGAAYVFAPQKGADAEMVELLDCQLRALDEVMKRDLDVSVATHAGAGAAGGMGAGCIAFMGAELRSGIDAVLDLVGFDALLDGAELVITGEGRIDAQSTQGKVVSGVAKRTGRRKIPLVCIAGSIAEGAEELYGLGVTAMFGTDRKATSFEECASRASENYQKTLEDLLRLIGVFQL